MRSVSYLNKMHPVNRTVKRRERGAPASCPHGVVVLLFLFAQCVLAETIPTLTNEWAFRTASRSDSAPAIGPDGTIYFGTFNGRLWALREDGSRKWVFRAGLEIRTAPALATN